MSSHEAPTDEKTMNPFAQAWLDAAEELGIHVIHPFAFVTKQGIQAETVGVYLPDFGSEHGALLTCGFDSDEICEMVEDTNYFQSSLNPQYYEPYNREKYIETLNDWGWYGLKLDMPDWFNGGYAKHGGS